MHMHVHSSVHLYLQMHLKRVKDLQAWLTDSTIKPMQHLCKCLCTCIGKIYLQKKKHII